ncbi:hypothetical protein Ancab_028780 [Ancistrocladus abbreviatus]
MLRQSSSRNQRSKGLKIKHALQTCLLLVISIWVFHQLKLFLNNQATNKGIFTFGRAEKVQNKHGEWKIGRKSLLRQEHGVDNLESKKQYETQQYGGSEIKGRGVREENSEIEREMEDEEHERIEDILDENSKEAFDGGEEQEEAIDSSKSSFDLEGTESNFEQKNLVGADEIEDNYQDADY